MWFLYLLTFWTSVSQVLYIRSVLLVIIGWLVGNAVFSKTAPRIFLIFCMKLGNYKGRKVTEPDFWKKKLIWKYSRKGLQISLKSDTLIFFSKTGLKIFSVFDLKLVLNIIFNFNEPIFQKNLQFGDITPRHRQKNSKIEVFGHFMDFASLDFLDFAHNDRLAWCLVNFLQFAGPVNVFLFLFFFVCFFVEFLFVCLFIWCYVMDCKTYYRVTWNQIEINNKINK